MSDELKPCPFCGQPGIKENYGEDGEYIICSNMECQLQEGFDPEAWNTRSIEDALRAERDALRAQVEQLKSFNAPLVSVWDNKDDDVYNSYADKACAELRSQVEQLTAERDRLRQALQDIEHGPVGYYNDPEYSQYNLKTFMDIARAALDGKE